MKRLLALLLMLLSMVSVTNAESWRVFDSAGLFSSEEEAAIEQSISQFQRKTNMDFVVLTTDDYLGDSIRDFAIWFYDSSNFGFGHLANGMLYYIDMNKRIPYLLTAGEMVDIFDDATISNAHETVYQFLVDGEYSEAAFKMIELATEAYEEYKKDAE